MVIDEARDGWDWKEGLPAQEERLAAQTPIWQKQNGLEGGWLGCRSFYQPPLRYWEQVINESR
jgi:hypothetical protein